MSAPETTVVVRPVPYASPVAQRLSTELMDEIDERYAGDPDPGGTPELAAVWDVRPDQVAPPGGTFLVAWLDGEPAGCGALRALVTGEPGVCEVKRMYTVPSARRRGVSRAILEALEAAAAELGYRRIQLETGVRQPEALALYESAGWHRIESYGQYAVDPLSVCFAKDLYSSSSGPGGPERTYHSKP